MRGLALVGQLPVRAELPYDTISRWWANQTTSYAAVEELGWSRWASAP